MTFECFYCLNRFEGGQTGTCPRCGGKALREVPVSPATDPDDPLTRSEKVVIRQFGTIDIGCGCPVDLSGTE